MRAIATSVFALSLLFFMSACEPASETQSETAAVSEDEPRDIHFELLATDMTGVAFSNKITESFENNILINSYLYNGGGVAVLDVNNDGLQDLYFSATQEPNRLYLNKGDFRFEDITATAGVGVAAGTKTGVTVVDINADGYADLYICRSGMLPTQERANLLFVNNGDLTFTEKGAEYGLDDRSASNHANFFDYDRDGDLDVYILNHPVNFNDVNKISARAEGDGYVRNTAPLDQWESDKLFRNEGNGKFVDVSTQAGISNRAWGLSATVSDFNQDGYLDIFVGNDYIEPDLLYINNQNGTFSIQTDRYFRHMSNHTMGVDIADFNNDARVDMVALDMIAEDNQRQKELMTTMVLDRYNSLVKYHYGHQVMRNVMQLNTGASPEQGAPYSDIGVLSGVSNTDWSWSPLLGDFDNDGFKDLYVTNGYLRDISNLDYLTYTVDSVMSAGGLTRANFNTIDEYLELIPTTPLVNYMFRNENGLTFRDVSYKWGMDQESYSNGSAYADLDADGDLDLIVNQISRDAMIYRNLSADDNRGNWLQLTFTGSQHNPMGTGARVRIYYRNAGMQYQELTPTRGFFSSSEHIMHFGLGQVARVDKLDVQWPDGKVQTLTDIDVNQRLVLRYSDAVDGAWEADPAQRTIFADMGNIGIDYTHAEDNFIDFDRERMIPHMFSNLGPAIAVGDVNGDGADDVFVGGAKNQAAVLFVQQGSGRFSLSENQPWGVDARFEDMGCIFFDADGDGDQDLYVVSGGSAESANSVNYQDRLYINDGGGQFVKARPGVLPTITSSGSSVTVHDYDADGDLDVFVGGLVTPGYYPRAPMTCLLENDNGTFTDVCAEVAPDLNKIGMVSDMQWADLDADGNEELVVVGEWLPVTVFRNSNGKLADVTGEFGLNDTEGWWNCITPADIDGDGDIDLLAGNLGLNSRLQGTQDEPLKLFVRDFDNNGTVDPVLAYYNGGKLYPLATRDMLIKQMPGLKKKYVYYTDYGDATMEEVFSPRELENADQYQAKIFASCWFENDGGKFRMHLLPVEAQFAPVNAATIADINDDGIMDMLLVGNSYSPDVETGRYDSGNGVVMYGSGDGNFQVVPNTITGFWATREARDLASVHLSDGRTLYLIANNNDRVEGYIKG